MGTEGGNVYKRLTGLVSRTKRKRDMELSNLRIRQQQEKIHRLIKYKYTVHILTSTHITHNTPHIILQHGKQKRRLGITIAETEIYTDAKERRTRQIEYEVCDHTLIYSHICVFTHPTIISQSIHSL